MLCSHCDVSAFLGANRNSAQCTFFAFDANRCRLSHHVNFFWCHFRVVGYWGPTRDLPAELFPKTVLSSVFPAHIPSFPAARKTFTANTVLCLCLFSGYNGYTPLSSLTVLRNYIVEQCHRCVPTASSTSCLVFSPKNQDNADNTFSKRH